MKHLISQIKLIQNSEVGTRIDNRLKDFQKIGKKDSNQWFEELCFCILAANTSSEMASKMQSALGYAGFVGSEEEIVKRLHAERCRFYNRRGNFIAHNNQHLDLKRKLSRVSDKRSWLVDNIKGFGWKEASHFLRNVGIFDHAIIDKHVVNVLLEYNLLSEKPKSWNQARYQEVEKILQKVADELSMSQGELDMYLWYMKTGKVLK